MGTGRHVHFVQGCLDVGQSMSPPLIRAAKSHFSKEGITIIDCPPGTSCPVIAAVRDSDLVVHHQVAMIPNLMHGGSMMFGCKLEGNNTLVLTPQYDKMVVPGMNMAPPKDGKVGYGDMAVRYVFKRLE